MKTLMHPRKIVTMITLTLVWCGLWGEISPANVAGGIAIAVVITLSGIGTPGRGGIRLIPLARLLGLVAVDLIESTVNVALEIVTPNDQTDESIVAVEVPLPTRDHLLLMIVAITLTPGTAVVDADPDTGTLYLHLLHDNQRESTIRTTKKLAALAAEALPVDHRERPAS